MSPSVLVFDEVGAGEIGEELEAGANDAEGRQLVSERDTTTEAGVRLRLRRRYRKRLREGMGAMEGSDECARLNSPPQGEERGPTCTMSGTTFEPRTPASAAPTTLPYGSRSMNAVRIAHLQTHSLATASARTRALLNSENRLTPDSCAFHVAGSPRAEPCAWMAQTVAEQFHQGTRRTS